MPRFMLSFQKTMQRRKASDLDRECSISDHILQNAMTTKTIIYKYEHAQIISTRIKQLLSNEKSKVTGKAVESIDAHREAQAELDQGLLKIHLYRRLPGNSCSKHDVQHMKLVQDFQARSVKEGTNLQSTNKRIKKET